MSDHKSLANWEAAAHGWGPRPPLSPGPEDIAWYARAVHAAAAARPLRALLLGVTPGIATMAWPGSTALVAVDWAAAMIKQVWPRHGLPAAATVTRANWRAMPLADDSREFAVSDGCYTVIGDLAHARALSREVSRVLAPGGHFALRLVCRGETPPAVGQVFDDLLRGRQTDLGLFRFLLAMAVQGDEPAGVCVSEVGRLWRERVPDPVAAGRGLGWRDGDLAAIERWRAQDVHYNFSTLAEFKDIVAPHFEVVACDIPRYPYSRHFLRLTLVNKK